MSLPTGLASMAIGVTTALIAESAPIGVFAGGLVLFCKKKYDELMKNRCEQFKNKVFELLKTDQKTYSFKFSSSEAATKAKAQAAANARRANIHSVYSSSGTVSSSGGSVTTESRDYFGGSVNRSDNDRQGYDSCGRMR